MYEDKELQEYRDLLKPPDHFEEGFDWKTIVGSIFIGFLMMPGSMYLQLVIGTGIGPAARWVTIILFAEMAKRSYTELKQQEIFILFFMAGASLASPFQGLEFLFHRFVPLQAIELLLQGSLSPVIHQICLGLHALDSVLELLEAHERFGTVGTPHLLLCLSSLPRLAPRRFSVWTTK